MSVISLVKVPRDVNMGLSGCTNTFMLNALGNPRKSYSSVCMPMTYSGLAKLIVTADVGPFRVTGLRPAVEDLKMIFAEVKSLFPDIYAQVGTAGVLCCRLVRGSKTAISNHSWGTAIDLTLSGVLDTRGDGVVQEGLISLAKVFNRYGWYWGAHFNTEDGMHFEASQQRITKWLQEGLLK